MDPVTFQSEVGPEFRWRMRYLPTVVCILFFLLIGRLFFLQVIEGERFNYLSENNRVRLRKGAATRGMVFDRNGQLLVDSRPSFDLVFVPEDAAEPETTLRSIARLIGQDEVEFLSLLQGGNNKRPPYEEIVLGKDIDWRSVVAVETRQLDFPGVRLRIRPRRSYVNNNMAAHLLGYIGEISPKQLKTLSDNGYSMGDEVGQFGLEKRWEESLRGRGGGQQVEVDALGRRVGVLREVKDIPGHSVFLTLDRNLQQTAYEALQGKEGAIVVLEVNTGAVLAIVSSPAFDPDIFARGITADEWRVITNDPLKPLNYRAIQGQYPPASTFKIVVTIAALEEGLVQPETRIFDPGYFTVGNRQFRDWKKGGHGWVDLHKAIVESCDTYFYQLGQQIGVDRIAQYARLLGLGEKTGIALDGEKEGLVPDTVWKKKRFGQPWFPGETPSVAIGQGYVSVTPLQMANLTVTVANGGTIYRPWFVRKVESLDGTLIREYGPEKIREVSLKQSTLKFIRSALSAVVNGDIGTGSSARSNLIEIAGKTGTAQLAEMRGGLVKSWQLPYAIRDHAWFVAYAPAGKPEIAVGVLVEHGGGGGAVAAPLAKMVIEKYASLKGASADGKLARRNGEIRVD